MDQVEELLRKHGIKDFDDLNPIEREEYFKILDVVEKSKVTLEDYKRHITTMRQSLEVSLVDEPEYIYSLPLPFLKRPNPKITQIKARLKNYLLLEALFDRPERARQMLEQYTNRKES